MLKKSLIQNYSSIITGKSLKKHSNKKYSNRKRKNHNYKKYFPNMSKPFLSRK